jgi:hypothetical protein
MHKSPMAMVLIGAVAVLLGLGIAGALVISSSDGRAASDTPTTTAAPPQTAPALTDEVVLTGLPPGATVRLDGTITSHPITLVRDNEPHEIEVSQPDHEPWHVTHVAAGPSEYEVELVPISPPDSEESEGEELAEVEEEATMASRRRRRGRMGEMMMGDTMSDDEGATAGMRDFRTLDY